MFQKSGWVKYFFISRLDYIESNWGVQIFYSLQIFPWFKGTSQTRGVEFSTAPKTEGCNCNPCNPLTTSLNFDSSPKSASAFTLKILETVRKVYKVSFLNALFLWKTCLFQKVITTKIILHCPIINEEYFFTSP